MHHEFTYGFHGAPSHTRRVLFLKPDYWLIADTLVPSDSEEHTYDALFHFDAEEAITADATRSVATTSEGAANVTVLPMASDGLSLTVVNRRRLNLSRP